jgi:hypothetical protein
VDGHAVHEKLLAQQEVVEEEEEQETNAEVLQLPPALGRLGFGLGEALVGVTAGPSA